MHNDYAFKEVTKYKYKTYKDQLYSQSFFDLELIWTNKFLTYIKSGIKSVTSTIQKSVNTSIDNIKKLLKEYFPSIDNVFTYKFWQPSLKELGIKYRRPYNTRHTYATNMLYNDLIVPVKLAQLLGHANTQMVYDVYVNYLDKQFDNFDKSIEVYQ